MSAGCCRRRTGTRTPLTLAMLMFDSSGVNKDAALDEHRIALAALIATAAAGVDDSVVRSCWPVPSTTCCMTG